MTTNIGMIASGVKVMPAEVLNLFTFKRDTIRLCAMKNKPVDATQQLAELAEQARPLIDDPNILDRVLETAQSLGVFGEPRIVKLVYLAVTSRILAEPFSMIVKGPSSAGKSHTTKKTLKLFPDTAVYIATAISPKALAYSTEDFKHRTIVIGEAAGLTRGDGAHFIRTLLSEGHIKHETVQEGGAKSYYKEGPTNLISTTTAFNVDAELETRLIMVPINDSNEQTARVMNATAEQFNGKAQSAPDLKPFIALQDYLALYMENRRDAEKAGGDPAKNVVVIPYATTLADCIPPVALRLRRDFNKILSLISIHALLHGATRKKDSVDRIIATIEDYAAIYDLIGDLVGEGADKIVKKTVRETVEAVKKLKLERTQLSNGGSTLKYRHGVPQSALVNALNRDKGNVSRRLAEAQKEGYLQSFKMGQETLWELGSLLPADGVVMPSPEALLHSCAEFQKAG